MEYSTCQTAGSSTVRQDAVTRDRRYGPLMAKRSEGRKLQHFSSLSVFKCFIASADLLHFTL